jgi:preprotein translocase subunit SecE
MAIQEDVKREQTPEEVPGQSTDEPRADASMARPGDARRPEERTSEQEVYDVALVGASSPTQLGTRRYVYAGYFLGAIAVAFLASKLIDLGWLRLQAWKPGLGEPHDEVVMPLAALLGGGLALYYWRRTRARQLAEEVATEMSKVTWPSRTEVTNGTFVVIVTTVISTVFFALMDKFWGFVTNLVYGGS